MRLEIQKRLHLGWHLDALLVLNKLVVHYFLLNVFLHLQVWFINTYLAHYCLLQVFLTLRLVALSELSLRFGGGVVEIKVDLFHGVDDNAIFIQLLIYFFWFLCVERGEPIKHGISLLFFPGTVLALRRFDFWNLFGSSAVEIADGKLSPFLLQFPEFLLLELLLYFFLFGLNYYLGIYRQLRLIFQNFRLFKSDLL